MNDIEIKICLKKVKNIKRIWKTVSQCIKNNVIKSLFFVVYGIENELEIEKEIVVFGDTGKFHYPENLIDFISLIDYVDLIKYWYLQSFFK